MKGKEIMDFLKRQEIRQDKKDEFVFGGTTVCKHPELMAKYVERARLAYEDKPITIGEDFDGDDEWNNMSNKDRQLRKNNINNKVQLVEANIIKENGAN